MITNQDRAAIRRIFEKIKVDTDRLLASGKGVVGQNTDPQMPNIIAAQNALRTCMEVIFRECMPHDEQFCGEMAVRLATYAISAAPIERHEDLTAAVIEGIPTALALRLRNGIGIKTVWQTDGVVHPNIPDKGDIQ